MKISKDNFTKNIGWKILSLIIAIGLWFTVINTENPLEVRTFTTSVQILNEDSLFERGYVVVNEDEINNIRVTVRLRGQRLALDNLTKSSTKVQANIDLNNILYAYDGNNPVSVPINIVIPSAVNNNFEIISKSVHNVTVDIQPYINKTFDVTTVVENTDEIVKELVQTNVTPKTVTVYGAKSIVNKIAEVKAQVAPETIDNGMEVTAVPKAYDSEGNALDKLTFSTNELKVELKMDNSKKARVISNVSGEPADGYEVTDVHIYPENIGVAGEEVPLFNFNILRLPDIDVNGANANITKTYKIKDFLPNGVRLLKNATGTEEITVVVTIEEESIKEVSIPSRNIVFDGLLEDCTAEVLADSINFNIKGEKDKLNEYIGENIVAHIDLSNLTEGLYDNLPLEIILPEGIVISGNVPTASVYIKNSQNQ